MMDLASILQDWETLEKRSQPKWALWIYFIGFSLCYFFLLWKGWQMMNLLLSVFKISLEAALGFYTFKLIVLFFYHVLFWAFIHFFIFFILSPFFVFKSLGMKKDEADLAERLKTRSVAFVIAFFGVLLSFNPFFLPLSFVILFADIYYLQSKTRLGLKHFLTHWRMIFKNGFYQLSITLIPGLNIFLLPHELVKKGEA